MRSSVRWVRWSIAMSIVVNVLISCWVVVRALVEPGHDSWVDGFLSDCRRWWQGDVDRSLVVRSAILLTAALACRLGIWLVLVAIQEARGRPSRRPAPRLLAFVLTSGVVWGGTVGEATAGHGSVTEANSGVEASALPPTSVVLVNDSSGLDIAGTAVVSGLIGAGVALRLKSRDRRDRRVRDAGSVVDDVMIDPPMEMASEFSTAERSFRQMIEVVRRVIEAEPDNRIRHVVDEKNGWIVIEFVDPPRQLPHSEVIHSRALRVRSPEQVATEEDLVDPRLPALLHVGRSLSGEIWISLDEYESFAVDCRDEEGERVWRHLCQSVVMGPSLESRGVVSDRDLGSYPGRRCFVAADGTTVDEVVERVGSSIAVVHEGSLGFPGIHRVVDGQVTTGLKRVSDEWRLLPADVAIRPVGSDLDEVTSIKVLLGVDEKAIQVDPPAVVETDETWHFMACVLGPPRVIDSTFEPVRFERGKAEELVIWLAFHPAQRKRSLARSALWLTPVQDATFSNITAAARRSMNAVRAREDGSPWVGITMSDELPLAEGVITDIEVLREAVTDTRLRPEETGVDRLRKALELVRGVPFASSSYTWSDGIGVCGEAATLVVRAATMMAVMCQENGDIDGVYWATAKGLLALPGHEELVATRLRAHATRGDRSALRVEWESFRRALASEWGDEEPSPRMMQLWRGLTADWSVEEGHQSGENSD